MEAIRVGAYARVSTLNQVRANDSSTDTQLQLIRSKAKFESEQARSSKDRREWKIVAEYREEGRSAKNTDRPELKRLMADVAAGKLDVVCVTKIDRITRSLIDFYELWGTFEKHQTEFIALSDNFETRSATGKAMLKITLVFAELERERTSERTKEKIQARRQQGMWFGGRVPLGYRIDPTNKTTLQVDEDAAMMVRKEFFERYLKLGSARALTKDLAQRGIRRPKGRNKRGEPVGGGLFMVQSVVQILSNTVYVAKREVEEGKLLDCVWKPIIEPGLFEKVQQLMVKNSERRPSGRTSPSYTFVLEGLIRCGGCGSTMTHASGRGTGGTYFYYKCNRKSRSVGQACKVRDVPAPAVEKFVLGELRKLSIDAKAVKGAVRHANEGRDVELVRVEAELKEKRFAEQEEGRALQRLLNTFEANDSDAPVTIKKRMREREATQQQLKEEIADLEAKRLDLKSKILDVEVVAEGYSKLPTLIRLADETGDRENLRTLLRNVVDVIEWRQDSEDPKKGAARVRLYELPQGLWGSQGPEKTQPGEPLISSPGRVKWLPEGSGSANLTSTFVIDLAEARKRRESATLVLPRVCRMLALADQFQRELDTGVVNRRSDLALLHGISKPRVTQLLDLHRLHPDILDYIRGLKIGKLLRPTTEKKMRAWVELAPAEQLKMAEENVQGFAEFLKARGSKLRRA